MDKYAGEFCIKKYKKLQDLFFEPNKKLLHGTRVDEANSIMENGLWIYENNIDLTTRAVDMSADQPSILAKYWYGAPFEGFDSRYNRCVIIALPNELAIDACNKIVEYYGIVPTAENGHYYNGVLAPEFIRGVCAPDGDFFSNPKWIMGLKNVNQLLDWHNERMNSNSPQNYDLIKPKLEVYK